MMAHLFHRLNLLSIYNEADLYECMSDAARLIVSGGRPCTLEASIVLLS